MNFPGRDGSFETDSGTNNTATRSFADDGTYTVRVQVRDNEGATAISELTVKIANRPPQPGLSITPNPAAPGQEVTFDASTSSDPDGSIQKYEFDFDGNDFEVQNGTNPVAKHTYAAAGTYDVRVRVTDNDGAAAIGTFHVTVQDAAVTPNKAPSAFVTAAPNPATTAQTVNFDASGSKDSDGTIVKYEWDLDGTGTYETNSGTNPKTSHQYAIAGKYLVTLRVTDNRGATATSQVVLTVTAPGGNNPGRVGVKALSSKVSPKRDARAPYVFKTSGKLTLPSGVTTAKGCNGRVAIQFKRGKKTISSRRTALRSNCTYKDSVTFRDSHRFGTSKSLRVSIKFQGNDVLLPKSAPTRTVRVK